MADPMAQGDTDAMRNESGSGGGARLLRRAVGAFEVGVSGILLVFMTSAIVTDVVMRYVLNRPWRGAGEAATAAFAWVVFLGGAAAARQRLHVRIQLVDQRLPRRVRIAYDTTVLLVTAGVVGMLAWLGWEMLQQPTNRQIPLIGISHRYVIAAVPIGLALTCAHYLLHVAGNLRDLILGREVTHEVARDLAGGSGL